MSNSTTTLLPPLIEAFNALKELQYKSGKTVNEENDGELKRLCSSLVSSLITYHEAFNRKTSEERSKITSIILTYVFVMCLLVGLLIGLIFLIYSFFKSPFSSSPLAQPAQKEQSEQKEQPNTTGGAVSLDSVTKFINNGAFNNNNEPVQSTGVNAISLVSKLTEKKLYVMFIVVIVVFAIIMFASFYFVKQLTTWRRYYDTSSIDDSLRHLIAIYQPCDFSYEAAPDAICIETNSPYIILYYGLATGRRIIINSKEKCIVNYNVSNLSQVKNALRDSKKDDNFKTSLESNLIMYNQIDLSVLEKKLNSIDYYGQIKRLRKAINYFRDILVIKTNNTLNQTTLKEQLLNDITNIFATKFTVLNDKYQLDPNVEVSMKALKMDENACFNTSLDDPKSVGALYKDGKCYLLKNIEEKLVVGEQTSSLLIKNIGGDETVINIDGKLAEFIDKNKFSTDYFKSLQTYFVGEIIKLIKEYRLKTIKFTVKDHTFIASKLKEMNFNDPKNLILSFVNDTLTIATDKIAKEVIQDDMQNKVKYISYSAYLDKIKGLTSKQFVTEFMFHINEMKETTEGLYHVRSTYTFDDLVNKFNVRTLILLSVIVPLIGFFIIIILLIHKFMQEMQGMFAGIGEIAKKFGEGALGLGKNIANQIKDKFSSKNKNKKGQGNGETDTSYLDDAVAGYIYTGGDSMKTLTYILLIVLIISGLIVFLFVVRSHSKKSSIIYQYNSQVTETNARIMKSNTASILDLFIEDINCDKFGIRLTKPVSNNNNSSQDVCYSLKKEIVSFEDVIKKCVMSDRLLKEFMTGKENISNETASSQPLQSSTKTSYQLLLHTIDAYDKCNPIMKGQESTVPFPLVSVSGYVALIIACIVITLIIIAKFKPLYQLEKIQVLTTQKKYRDNGIPVFASDVAEYLVDETDENVEDKAKYLKIIVCIGVVIFTVMFCAYLEKGTDSFEGSLYASDNFKNMNCYD